MTLIGNSFKALPEDSAPCIRLSNQAIRFPPCRLGEAAHASITICNDGLTPAQIQFADFDSLCFAFKPTAMVVPPKSFCTVCIRCKPSRIGTVRGNALLVANNHWKAGRPVTLAGSCCRIQVQADAGSQLLCKPVCPGSKSTRKFHLSNTGRMPVAFAWQCSVVKGCRFQIHPAAGVIQGTTQAALTCTFQPEHEGQFDALASCQLCSNPQVDQWAQQASMVTEAIISKAATNLQTGDTDRMCIRLTSSGTVAALRAEPQAIQLGPIPIGQQSMHKIMLTNDSDGLLEFGVDLRDSQGRTLRSFDSSSDLSENKDEIKIVALFQVLPARATKELSVAVQPSSRHAIAWSLAFRIIGSDRHVGAFSSEVRLSEGACHCLVFACGLMWSDGCCDVDLHHPWSG
jgi:hypothetical protein